MTYNVQQVPVAQLELNRGQIPGIPANPRTWTKKDVQKIARSLKDTPELFEMRPVIAVDNGKKAVILCGSLRFCGAQENKTGSVPAIILPKGMAPAKLKEIIIKDNGAFGAWDFDALANEWDDQPLPEWGVPAWDTSEEEPDKAEIERREKEFRERMEAGEISEEDEEYQAFLDKFKLKKTTDDCYTPEPVYNAVADWVAQEYGLNRADFVRPFYPGGDYQAQKYKPTDVVVDNPPFSILAEIMKFYAVNGVRFFLFGPTLTLFSSSSSSSSCTAIPVSVPIVYENGASVNTSFLTNLEPEQIRFRSAPSLYAAVKAGNDKNLAQMRKELPKYAYDHHVVTAPFVGALSRLGIDFCVSRAESESVNQLDSQKASGKAIYGKGYLIGEAAFERREKAEREKAEREKAEREKAEREKAERWELSGREWEIVKNLL